MSAPFDYMARANLERAENWRDIIREVPPVRFDKAWDVTIIPPFAGAVARFLVERDGVSISVYLDWYGRLGCMDQPYWEIHPSADGDCERFLLTETDQMVAAIRKSIRTHLRQRAKATGADQ